jgi:hypothetical protein
MAIWRYESLAEPIVPVDRFLRRLGANLALAAALIAVSLGVGMAGYHFTDGMGWLDAFLNASMILSGMGPVTVLVDPAAKLFAGCYALYSGLMLVATATLVLAPVMHRVLHRLHVRE